jgi:hypothetical protein
MGTANSLSRRARADVRRRRTRRNVSLLSAGILVVGAGGVAAFSLNAEPSTGPKLVPATSQHGATSTSQASKSIIDRIKSDNPPRPLSHEAPLRVWVGGDSLSGHVGPALGTQLTDTGIVKVTVDFKVGSGLHDNGLRNWSKRVPEQMTKHKPDVAIFMIGANDASIVSRNLQSWGPQYRKRVGEMMELLGGAEHRTVYWIGPPPLKQSQLERGTLGLSDLMADEATHHKHVVFINAYDIFDDEEHHYTNRIDMPAINKQNVLVRISDGVHFTNDGADWLAYQLSLLLDEQWSIAKQSGGKPISVSIESNGGSVPGYTPRTNRRSTTTTQYLGASTSTAPPISVETTTSVPPSSSTASPTTVTPTTAHSTTTNPVTTVP